jgi:hypothetical protein
MTDRNIAPSIRFYFSFRSPYAWLAAERLESELGGLGVPIRADSGLPDTRAVAERSCGDAGQDRLHRAGQMSK